MRLIDADILKVRLFSLGILYPLHDKTIDELAFQSPIVHGHWIDSQGKFSACSICGTVNDKNIIITKHLMPYCFGCGSKMDEEVSE